MSKTIKTLLTLSLAVSVCAASYGQAEADAGQRHSEDIDANI